MNIHGYIHPNLDYTHNKHTIFIDLDDTVANFRKIAESILQRKLSVNCRDITDDEWTEISKHDNFYLDMEMTEGAIELLEYCQGVRGYDVAYLGALPSKLDHEWAKKTKWLWIRKNFPMKTILVDSSHTKQEYAQENILIDDKQYIIDQWNAAGGYGIVCHNCNQAREDLEKYLKSSCILK